MFPKRQAEFATWHVPGLTQEIVYSVSLMKRLAAQAAEGLKRVGGGEELGGVLFGTMENREVRITMSRVLRCEHARGPGLLLTPGDDRALQALVESCGTDPELRDLVAVGWYRSRIRGGITLDEEDTRLFNRYFPLALQVALVLQPRLGESTLGGFFCRSPKGSLWTDSSYQEFEAGSGVSEAAELEEEPAAPVVEPVRLRPPPEMLVAPRRKAPRGRVAVMGAIGFVLAVGAAVTGFVWGRSNAAAKSVPRFALHLEGIDGGLRAVWNGESAAIAQAKAATIEVNDGATSAGFPVTAAQLRRGYWPIANQAEEVWVKLKVDTGEGEELVEVARYAGRPRPAKVDAPAEEVRGLLREVEANRTALAAQTKAGDEIARRVEELNGQLRRRLAVRGSAVQPTPPVKPAPAPQSGNTQIAAVQAPSPPASSPQDVRTAETPAQPPPSPLFTERPAQTAKPSVSPTAPPPPEPPRPAYTGPSSGRLIWTGDLAARATLTIENRRASAGNITGMLPPVSVRVSVYPAELQSGGLSVYSGQQRHAGGNVVEARSAQNGWLETRYVYNPDRARGIAAIEIPTQGNAYKLTLRAGDRPVRAVVIDWQVAP